MAKYQKRAEPTPSQTQARVLEALVRVGGNKNLYRLPGGFWTMYGVVIDDQGVPFWNVNIQTIRAMEERGWLERTNTWADEWRDERRLTKAGERAIHSIRPFLK